MAQRTWTYVYQDAQGKRHEGEMIAPQKDDVYAALREQGIRAQRVTERVQPIVRRGFRGLRPRDWCLVAAIAVALLSLTIFLVFSRHAVPDARPPSPATSRIGRIETPVAQLVPGSRRAQPRPRRALPRAQRDLDAIFAHPSERLLASFAEPGRPVAKVVLTQDMKEDLVDALESDIMILPTDDKDVVALKRIVAGMKDDVLELIGAGLSIDEVFYRYEERQRMEAEYRAGIVRSLKGNGDLSAANARLAAMGMAPIDNDGTEGRRTHPQKK